MRIRLHLRWFFLLTIMFLILLGCASSFKPQPLEEVQFLGRAQTKSEGNLLVKAAVLSAEETEAFFGFALYKKGIQPIWFTYARDRKIPLPPGAASDGIQMPDNNVPAISTWEGLISLLDGNRQKG